MLLDQLQKRTKSVENNINKDQLLISSKIVKFPEIIYMEVVIASVSELGGIWYPNQSASSSIRSILSPANHKLQHRGRFHDNRAIQASLHVKVAVKSVFWPSQPYGDSEVTRKGRATKPKLEHLHLIRIQMIMSLKVCRWCYYCIITMHYRDTVSRYGIAILHRSSHNCMICLTQHVDSCIASTRVARSSRMSTFRAGIRARMKRNVSMN